MSIQIRSTLRDVPIRAVIYGPDGVGKSTFCASAPGAVFIASEDGLDNIDAKSVDAPKTWVDLLAEVEELTSDARCKTIVIDTLDWAEPLCWDHVVAQGNDGKKVKNIEAFGYGKGYVAAVGEWRVLLAALQRAGEAGKNVLLTAHAARKTVKNPVGEDYEQWQIKLNDKAAGLIREWSHIVAFAELDISTVDDGGRTKGIFSGKRVLRTAPSAGYQGKTRLALPAKLPLDWASFAAAVEAGKPQSLDALELAITAKLAELGNADVELACGTFLNDRGRTVTSLTEAIATVDGYLSEKGEKAAE